MWVWMREAPTTGDVSIGYFGFNLSQELPN